MPPTPSEVYPTPSIPSSIPCECDCYSFDEWFAAKKLIYITASSNEERKACIICGVQETSQWRRELCNACGLATKRLLDVGPSTRVRDSRAWETYKRDLAGLDGIPVALTTSFKKPVYRKKPLRFVIIKENN
jgi:hypothetical protein